MAAERSRGRGARTVAGRPDRTAVVAHELRGPLGAVAAAADLLLARDLAPEDRRLVHLIRLAGAQALAVSEDLVADAGLGADRLRITPSLFDPAETIAAVADLWSPQIADQGATLTLDVAPDTPRVVSADEGRVRQILFNLLSNAFKASSGGHIRIALAPRAGAIAFTVADDGPGFPEAFSPEPFASGGSERPGAGLGLWISGRIAEALDGSLTLGNGDSGGAVATFVLPTGTVGTADGPVRPRGDRRRAPPPKAGKSLRSSRKAPMKDRAASRSAAVSPLSGLSALVVDDSAVSRMLMQAILESFDMTVETAAGSDDAIALAIARRPDVAILDWTLARETGGDVLDALDLALEGDLPPVISVSADARALLGSRVAAHVVKPFTPRELHAALERAIHQARESAAAG